MAPADSLRPKGSGGESLVLAFENPHAVAAVSLGRIHGFVRKLQCAVRTALEGRIDDGHPDADSGNPGRVIDVGDLQVLDAGAQLLGEPLSVLARDIKEDHGELFSAVACGKIEWPLGE